MITDKQGIILSVNPTFQVMTGYAEAEVVGKRLNILQSGIHDENGEIDRYIGVFMNISAQKTAEEGLKRLAHHDSLTGAANWYPYHARLSSMIKTSARYGQKMAVFFLDLDRFKQINDTFGHTSIDELLIGLSKRLRRLLGNKDFLAWLGGDEFSIALQYTSSACSFSAG